MVFWENIAHVCSLSNLCQGGCQFQNLLYTPNVPAGTTGVIIQIYYFISLHLSIANSKRWEFHRFLLIEMDGKAVHGLLFILYQTPPDRGSIKLAPVRVCGSVCSCVHKWSDPDSLLATNDWQVVQPACVFRSHQAWKAAAANINCSYCSFEKFILVDALRIQLSSGSSFQRDWNWIWFRECLTLLSIY